MHIILSVGHGLNDKGKYDPGAVSKYDCKPVEEFKECKAIFEKVKLSLVQFSQYIEYVPPELSLVDTIKYINQKARSGDIAIELHLNSNAGEPGTGCMIYYYKDKILANIMLGQYQKGIFIEPKPVLKDTESRFKRLGFCRDLICEGFIIEMGFINNPTDMYKIRKFADKGIVNIILYLINRSRYEEK